MNNDSDRDSHHEFDDEIQQGQPTMEIPESPAITLSELVQCIGNEQRMLERSGDSLSPELERRVRDFRLAQQKRQAQYGMTKRWGVFGMYLHLSNIRADLDWAMDAAYRRQHNLPYLTWADFEHAQRQHARRTYYCTYSVVAVCTILLLVEFAVNGWSIEPLSVNPMIGPSAATLVRVGARDTPRIVNDGQWFRLFTPMFLHAGIIHFIVNMAALYFIGSAVEQNHGFLVTAVLFVLPGLGGNVLSALFLPQYISVGASGSIFGLLGACIADIFIHWKLLFIKQNMHEDDADVLKRNCYCIFWLVLEISVNIILGLVTPVIDNWTHLGGLLYGGFIALSILPSMDVAFFGVKNNSISTGKIILLSGDERRTNPRITLQRLRHLLQLLNLMFVRYLSLIVSLVLIASTTIWLSTLSDPTTSPCPSCRYFSCVPFPFFQQEKWWYCDDCDFVTGTLYMNDSNSSSTESNHSFYTKVQLNCPDNNSTLMQFDVSSLQITELDVISKMLPGYCRKICPRQR